MGNARVNWHFCFRHRLKIIVLVISACALVAVVFLFKSEELHARRRLGPKPLTDYHNPQATALLRQGFLQGRNGTKIRPSDLEDKDLYGKEGQELRKERKRLAILEQANVSMHNELAKGSDSIIGISSHKKYAIRAEAQKALE